MGEAGRRGVAGWEEWVGAPGRAVPRGRAVQRSRARGARQPVGISRDASQGQPLARVAAPLCSALLGWLGSAVLRVPSRVRLVLLVRPLVTCYSVLCD